MVLLNKKNDIELLQLIRSGDRRAFEEMYNRYALSMIDYIVKVLRSEDEAMDIIQEIFISLWKRRETLEIQTSLKSYLFRSARNLSIRYIEQHLSKENFLETLVSQFDGFAPSVVTDLEVKELEEQINDAVRNLPEKMREIFQLSRFENLSYHEIAERLQISDTTVKKQISNALKRIRQDVSNDTRFSLILTFLFLSTQN